MVSVSPSPRSAALTPAFLLSALLLAVAACAPSPSADGAAAEGAAEAPDAASPEPAPVEPVFLNPAEAAGQDLPFSEAVRVGDLLFLSGKVGRKPGTMELVEGGIGPETRQTMENIQAVLERHGSSLERVVKCTVFLADIDEWEAMNEVYRTFFPGDPPARSALGASGLALDARVEIECIAVAGE